MISSELAEALKEVTENAGGDEPSHVVLFCPEDFAILAGCTIEEAYAYWAENACEDGTVVLENRRAERDD